MLKKHLSMLVLLLTCNNILAAQQALRSPSTIIKEANSDAWRSVNPEHILKITLSTGPVYVELNPQLAPKHSENIKVLAKEQFYSGLNIYRFVESFVAQGGDQTGKKVPKQAKKSVQQEFYHNTKQPLPITKLNLVDGYAPVTGFLNGFAVAQNAQGTKTWLTHCIGAFAMARGNSEHSGGTEFYFTLAPMRYLDKNITVFGRVLTGMEHVQRLHRTPTKGEIFNPILKVEVLADIAEQDTTGFKVFNTEHPDFQELIETRKNRPSSWFVDRPNHTDVCAVPVPIKTVTQ